MSSDQEKKGVTLKIAMLGPRQSGKTKISNHIYGLQMPVDYKYDPTVGARILPFKRDVGVRNKNSGDSADFNLNVELWDCSGDQKYEPCWPAVMKELQGIIVVYDPTSKAQADDVRIWCEYFCKNAGLQTDQSITVRAGTRTVIVPIVNVNTQTPTAKQPKDGDDEVAESRSPSSADVEFLKFVGGTYNFHPEADERFRAPPLQLSATSTAGAGQKQQDG